MPTKKTKQAPKTKSGIIMKDPVGKMPASFYAVKKNPDKYKNRKV